MTPLELEVGWSPPALRGPNNGRDAAFAAFIVHLVALETGVPAAEIAAATRQGAEAARARQLAIYLAHTAWGWPLARVASAFGRDRSTASYACQQVEDRRDEARFDLAVARLERCARTAPAGAGPLDSAPSAVLRAPAASAGDEGL